MTSDQVTYNIKARDPVLALSVLLDTIEECKDIFASRKNGCRNGVGAQCSTGEWFYVYKMKSMWVIEQDEVKP